MSFRLIELAVLYLFSLELLIVCNACVDLFVLKALVP